MICNERACAYIDLDALLYNLENIKKHIPKETGIIAVIKTDAYGHGALPIAKELEKLPYVHGYATATAEESLALREAGMKKPILCLGYTFPESYHALIVEEVEFTVFRMDQAKLISMEAVKTGKTAKLHIKLDTGMSRIGITPNEEGLSFVKEVSELDNISVVGVFSHFAKADETDKTSADKQFELYESFVSKLEIMGIATNIKRHIANSAGILDLKKTHLDLVRAGIILYGLWPSEQVPKDTVDLRPLLSLKSHVVYVKEIKKGTPVSYGGTYIAPDKKKIATIPVGYGDGYPRSLSNKGYVLIRGKKAPIVGRICMDQFMVDVTDIDMVQNGDEVILIGRDGDVCITMEELGELSGRFNYEFACDLSKRIPRVYVKEENSKI